MSAKKKLVALHTHRYTAAPQAVVMAVGCRPPQIDAVVGGLEQQLVVVDELPGCLFEDDRLEFALMIGVISERGAPRSPGN